MKGVILAGGTGSRLYPLTKVTNKHLLAVGRYPMLYHAIAKLVEVNIRDILIVTGTEHVGAIVGTVGSGKSLGIEVTYRVQDGAGGIAQALALAENFIHGDRFVVILGDNIFEASLGPFVDNFTRQRDGARLLLTKVADPQRFGVAEIVGGRLVGIDEKPAIPKSDYIVTGLYMYDAQVFNWIPTHASARGELEITDVNNAYLRVGKLEYDVLPGWWTDAGTFPSLMRANHLAEHIELPLFTAPEVIQ